MHQLATLPEPQLRPLLDAYAGAVAARRRFIDAMAAVAPGCGFLHYSYCVTSPLPASRHGLTAKREAWTPLNVPPASVWRYGPDA